MVPVSLSARNSHSSRLIYTLFSLASHYVHRFFQGSSTPAPFTLARRAQCPDDEPHKTNVAFAVLIPILVLLSGVFAGLTLGYMSLDETQLNVLSISGTPKQREYANKIKPIRKNGHLLLVTLLLANMIVNESLPVIADPVLGGGFQGVVVSTVLIVIFAEIIPQSLFTRHGLYLGAKMAWFTKILIYLLGVIAWPVAKLLEFVLGSHHGIIYRRAELKELIAMHSSHGVHGGDLKTDTVTIIGATLDLQEKVVKQAMTPISDVFMLSIDSKLDYDLLKKICQTGHSRVPVYEEVEVPVSVPKAPSSDGHTAFEDMKQKTQKVKKIVGILLVKQCVLLDPKDATPLRKIPLNKVPFVPNNEPLLGLLDKFQEGRSHMAIVSRFSVEKAASVKKVVKRGLTQRLRERVGMGDSDSSDEEKDHDEKKGSMRPKQRDIEEGVEDNDTLTGDGSDKEVVDNKSKFNVNSNSGSGTPFKRGRTKKRGGRDVEMGVMDEDTAFDEKDEKAIATGTLTPPPKSRRASFQLPKAAAGMTSMSMLEQSMPADAVLAKEGAEEFLQGFDPAVMPLGIITLEDVLEELIGEEIYDEFDQQGAHGDPYVPLTQAAQILDVPAAPPPPPVDASGSGHKSTTPILKPLALKGFDFLRSRSAPPTRDGDTNSADHAIRFTDAAAPAVPRVPPPSNIEMPRPIMGVSRHSSSIVTEPVVAPIIASDPALGPDIEAKGTPPSSRSGSPGAPLEALLYDRKRRMMNSSGTGAGPIHSPAISPVGSSVNLAVPGTGPSSAHAPLTRTATVKGTRFKSSPLGGGDRTGVVVAEQIKGGFISERSGSKLKVGSEEGQIPNESDQDGLHKGLHGTENTDEA